MKLKTLASSLLFAVATLGAGVASAAVLTYDLTTPSLDANFSRNLLLQKFDGSLGTLDSIVISLDGSATSTLTLTNKKGGKTPNLSVAAQLTLSVPGKVVATQTATVASFNELLAKGATKSVTNTVTLASAPISIDAAYFSQFTGGAHDTLATSFALMANSTEINLTNIDFTKVTSGVAHAHIVYNYTVAAVPEPETYGMLLLGMGVVAFAAKRKSRSAQA